MGGAVGAIEQGYMQSEMADHAYQYEKAIETGRRTVVGVNKFVTEEAPSNQDILKVDSKVGERQIARLHAMKEKRNQAEVDAALDELRKVCTSDENVMPGLIKAVKTYATLGEICDVMREVFGEYQPEREVI